MAGPETRGYGGSYGAVDVDDGAEGGEALVGLGKCEAGDGGSELVDRGQAGALEAVEGRVVGRDLVGIGAVAREVGGEPPIVNLSGCLDDVGEIPGPWEEEVGKPLAEGDGLLLGVYLPWAVISMT
jgi:hypothetical protein